MYISIFSDELDGSFECALATLSSNGYKSCDLRSNIARKSLHDLDHDALRHVKEQLASHAISIGALQSSLAKVHLPDKETQLAEERKLDGIIRAADALGCRLVRAFNFWQPPAGVQPLDQDRSALDRVLEMFAPLARKAANAGLILALENCGQTPEEVHAILNELGYEKFGLAWDVHNHWNSEACRRNEQAYIIQHVRRARMIHVKAESILPELNDSPPPWERILRACSSARMAGPVSIETHNPRNSGISNTEATLRAAGKIRLAWPTATARNIHEAVAETIHGPRSYSAKPVGFVVVGMGMGRVRARDILATPGCDLIGVCDRDGALAERVGRSLGVRFTTDLDAWLSDPRVEVVFVVTPTGLHGKLAKDAMNSGKHVLTTKPMEASLDAADEMIEASRAASRLLAVDFEYRYRPKVLDLKSAVDSGKFGQVFAVNVILNLRRDQHYFDRGGWRGTRKVDGGGVLSNQAIHLIDQLIYLFGLPDEVRSSVWTQHHNIESEDMASSTWVYKNGLVVNLVATTNYPAGGWYERFELHGSKGAYISTEGGPEGDKVQWFFDGKWQASAPRRASRPWLNSMDNLAAAIRTGVPLVCSGEDGRRSQSVLDALYRSSASEGSWVKPATLHVTSSATR
jgi:predicted dehydrogenase/sugar phosphate isomerase/epimerase